MAKVSAKDAIILMGGYNFSTYAMNYEAPDEVDAVDVTGFTDGSHNFIPGQKLAKLTCNMLWDSAAAKTVAVLKALPWTSNANITIIPEGYVLGNASISMPFLQANFGPAGDPASAISAGSIAFLSRGDNAGVEHGYALAHGTITSTTTGTGFDDISGGAVTAACAGTLHIWTACATDTYVVKIQHSTALGSGYADLVTFTKDGSAIGSERVTVASGTVNRYRRVLATRTGSAGDSFGFSVHFWHA